MVLLLSAQGAVSCSDSSSYTTVTSSLWCLAQGCWCPALALRSYAKVAAPLVDSYQLACCCALTPLDVAVLYQLRAPGSGDLVHPFVKPWFTTWESAAACWVRPTLSGLSFVTQKMLASACYSSGSCAQAGLLFPLVEHALARRRRPPATSDALEQPLLQDSGKVSSHGVQLSSRTAAAVKPAGRCGRCWCLQKASSSRQVHVWGRQQLSTGRSSLQME